MAHKAFRTHARSAYNLGRVEMARGEIDAAIAAMTVAANQAHPLAAMTVAQLYEGGTRPVHADAVPFYGFAAEDGVPEAQLRLGTLLDRRRAGFEPAPERGAYWFRKAASQGVTEAAFELGWAFENGLGVPRDPITAARWYNRANEGSINATPTSATSTPTAPAPRDEARAVDLIVRRRSSASRRRWRTSAGCSKTASVSTRTCPKRCAGTTRLHSSANRRRCSTSAGHLAA
ncbi:MAG: tetratricopeptide repeat protein [Paracoccaceae bacterium]